MFRMNTPRFCFAALVLVSLLGLVRADGWLIETDYTDGSCQTPSMLYIISVLPINQTTDCFATSNGGSIQGSCDLSASPITYSANKFSDNSCQVADVDAPVNSQYCLRVKRAALSCADGSDKTVPAGHVSGLTMVAGFAYFSGSTCDTSMFYHAELAPVTSCPETYPPSDRTPNTCYASRGNKSQNWVCGTVADVLASVGFSL